jgi:hypothetical protein
MPQDGSKSICFEQQKKERIDYLQSFLIKRQTDRKLEEKHSNYDKNIFRNNKYHKSKLLII